MGPSKFIAPLKKGSGQSFSSALSSSSSLGSGNQDVQRAGSQIQSDQGKAVGCSNSKGLHEPSKRNERDAFEEVGRAVNDRIATETLKQEAGPSADRGISKSLKSLDEPPKKKMKTESASKVTMCEENHEDDKENVCPVANKPRQDKKPFISLTDEEYELIFDSVLRKQQQVNDHLDVVENNALNQSKDMFEISQSDLEDSEGEQSECAAEDSCGKNETSVKEKDDTHLNQNHDVQITNDKATLNNPSSSIVMSTNTKTDGGAKESKQNPVGLSTEDGLTKLNIVSKSQTEEAGSQGSSGMDLENFHTSQVEKRTSLLNSEPFVTPQRTCSPKILGLSQELNQLSASSFIKATVTPGSQRSQVLKPAPSPLQTSSSAATSPSCTPKQPTLSQKLHSSTPAATPTKKVPILPKNSELLLSPVRQSPTRADAGSSSPNTLNGSQQFSQEICVTPPPPGQTAKERLLWLQKKRLAGIWVQCDERECKKWRYLPDCHDPTTLPDKWFCRMHPDEEFNNCDAPEKRLSLHAEEDMIFNKYSPGSIVWAKLSGYPWWPAMVEDDPDLEQFYWLNEFSDIPTWYHVVFFDEEDRSSCCRAWVQKERLREFQEEPLQGPEFSGYKRRVALAYKEACQAKQLDTDQRLTQYSFASRYKGPIGGFMTRRYDGPVGYREPASK